MTNRRKDAGWYVSVGVLSAVGVGILVAMLVAGFVFGNWVPLIFLGVVLVMLSVVGAFMYLTEYYD